jgi:rubredoxin
MGTTYPAHYGDSAITIRPVVPNDMNLPVHCPVCGNAVTITIDVDIPLKIQQIWVCPKCRARQTARFDAKIKWVGNRFVPPEPPASSGAK